MNDKAISRVDVMCKIELVPDKQCGQGDVVFLGDTGQIISFFNYVNVLSP